MKPGGYSRIHHCRGCDADTRQLRAGHENTTKPLVEYWRCATCSMQLITYADVADVEGLCLHLADRWLAGQSIHDYGDVRSIDRADLHSAMMETTWELYVGWDGRGTFLGYATQPTPGGPLLIVRGAVAWIRAWRGRTAPKPLAVAVSLDARTSPFAPGGLDDTGGRRGGATAALGYDGDDGESEARGDRLGSLTTEGPGSVRHDSDSALRRAFAEGSRLAARKNRGVGVRRAQLPSQGGA